MKINLYSNGSYIVDHGWKAASFPPDRELPPLVDVYDEVGREGEDARREPFLWKTDNGRLMLVEDMHTKHLINALNMIWRNVFGIKNDRPEIMDDWASSYVNRAALEFSKELQSRVENE